MKPGWRKLSAWALLFALGSVATFLDVKIDANTVDLLKWATGALVLGNAVEHIAGKLSVTVGAK